MQVIIAGLGEATLQLQANYSRRIVDRAWHTLADATARRETTTRLDLFHTIKSAKLTFAEPFSLRRKSYEIEAEVQVRGHMANTIHWNTAYNSETLTPTARAALEPFTPAVLALVKGTWDALMDQEYEEFANSVRREAAALTETIAGLGVSASMIDEARAKHALLSGITAAVPPADADAPAQPAFI